MAIAANVAEKYVELSHGKTRYLEAGTGHPTILLHGVGFTGGADGWALNIGPLSEKLRVIAPDCVGWGKGDRLDLEYSFAYLVDFVREFQDALGLESSHIVGHSMGGWLASLFAYESPNRVDKLVLVASGGAAPRTLASMTNFKPPTREQIIEQAQKRIDPKAGVDLEAYADQEMAKAQIPGAVEAYQRILNHMNNNVTRQRYNTLRRMPYIKAPTLIVWGRQDSTNALELGEQTHQAIKGSKMVVIENCEHYIPTEHPDEFNKALLDFLPD
jgi:pimeloyl-ACP methyl ester carboxylesterase